MSRRREKRAQGNYSPRAVAAISSFPCDRETLLTIILLSCAVERGGVAAMHGCRGLFPAHTILQDFERDCVSMVCFWSHFSAKPRSRLHTWEVAHPCLVVHEANAKEDNCIPLQPPETQGCGSLTCPPKACAPF